ncbi:MAG: glycosyltransferase family 2 protein [Eubacterium sp.]
MKVLTVAIPSYNSQDYIEKSIRSALTAGDKVEILVIDDGSTDKTLEIAQFYEKRYPNIVRAIHKENGGHGDAVNCGIKNATGVYFKVLDSDDCLGTNALNQVVEFLESTILEENLMDMVISDFLYDKQGVKHKKVMGYKGAMPKHREFEWKDVKFGDTQYLLMHSVIYRTQILRDCKLELPKHTFYVDNIYIFQPLPYVKKMYYLDVVLYKYFIGRDDQSVHEDVMMKRIDQQIRVTKLMIDIYNSSEDIVYEKKLKKAMFHYLDMMMCVSSIMLILINTEESLNQKKDLWRYLRTTNPDLYIKSRYSSLGIAMNLKGKAGRKASIFAYRIAQKLFGFN